MWFTCLVHHSARIGNSSYNSVKCREKCMHMWQKPWYILKQIPRRRYLNRYGNPKQNWEQHIIFTIIYIIYIYIIFNQYIHIFIMSQDYHPKKNNECAWFKSKKQKTKQQGESKRYAALTSTGTSPVLIIRLAVFTVSPKRANWGF